MKRAILFVLLSQIVSPLFAAERVTVDQLSQVIAASQGQRDAKIAGHLRALELTERLSSSKLAAMEASLPGPESRQVLVMVADQSAFLDPPAAEIPSDPAPSFAEQHATIAKTIEYVQMMELRLPNLFANRETIHFEDSPPGLKVGTAGGDFNPAQPLHPVSRTTVTVSYRSGKDFVEVAGKEQPASTLSTRGLSGFGEFGAILSTVLIDLPKGKLVWKHWEQGATRPVAVFGFSVPKAASHYAVRFCCMGARTFQQFSGYHGEITINPDDGAILRITILADLFKDDPIIRADLVVEYSAVQMGTRTYICPAKSIAISLALASAESGRFGNNNGVPGHSYRADTLADFPKQAMLNEVNFDHYHLFQSESRVLTAENQEPSPTSNTAMNAETVAVPASDASNYVPATAQATTFPASPATAESIASVAAPSRPLPEPATSEPAKQLTPEITVTPQKSPLIPDTPTSETKFTLRVTSRIVDVSISTFDKKGRPVTDLTPDDFEIYDSGSKQSLRSFSRAAAATAIQEVAATAHTQVFSNRAEATDSSAQPAASVTSASNTIIFFDATSLQFNDLTHARDQVLKILGTLPSSEPVGLYVRIGFGFRVLLEATTDRKALTTTLNAWKPDARDIARAQMAEERNQQQFDTLRSPAAVASTYATVGGGGGGPMIGSDPRLFNLGEEPTREALSVLVAVAAHMGAIPGHKNLVWIASDNVLADWSDQSADGDEGRMGPNSIGTYSIRTQEALNNAHVSLYPFDASQLETDATDASLQKAGVELDPSDSLNPNFKAPAGGRSFTRLRTRTHTVQVAIQQLAHSTGGQSFGRSGNVIANLNRVIADSKAVYLLSFSPDTLPDDKYHQIKVTVPRRRDITLRYRSGYLYNKEPANLKERFAQALWQPFDTSEISLTAHRMPATGGAAVSLNIAAADVGLVQQNDRWTGKLDIFLVQRDDTGAGALVKEQTLALNLSSASYEKIVRNGIPFEQYLDSKQNAETVRMIVVDENSGRIGSVTLPAAN